MKTVLIEILKAIISSASVRASIAIALTIVFCILQYQEKCNQDFITVYTAIIGYFFAGEVKENLTR